MSHHWCHRYIFQFKRGVRHTVVEWKAIKCHEFHFNEIIQVKVYTVQCKTIKSLSKIKLTSLRISLSTSKIDLNAEAWIVTSLI